MNETLKKEVVKNWSDQEPYVVIDPFWKKEWVLEHPVRYYVVESMSKNEWFICDRWTDLAVHGTQSKSRAESIRLFYKWCNRGISKHYTIPQAMKGVAHHGETG